MSMTSPIKITAGLASPASAASASLARSPTQRSSSTQLACITTAAGMSGLIPAFSNASRITVTRLMPM